MFRLIQLAGECLVVGVAADTKPTPTSGFCFYETDTSKFYLANGAAWNEVLNAGYEVAGAVATHAAAADPHTGYQKESEKNAASGYAGLDGSSKLTGSQQTYGTGVNTACVGNDARLSDSRTPLTHATSHQDGGSDELALDASQTTTGQFAIGRLASGTPDGTKFVRDDGTLVTPSGGHVIEEEGTPVTQRTNMNFTGAGVAVADTGGKTVVTISGGAGSFAISETEVDFGSMPVESAQFTVTDASISSTNEIMCTPSGNAATGRVGNDYSWENFSFSATAGTGEFTLYATCGNGSVVGKRKVFYTYS